MIYGCLDSKTKKANTVHNFLKGREVRFFPSAQGKAPADASCVIVYGTLRGMSEVIQDCRARNIPWMYMDNGYLKKDHRIILDATAPITMKEGRRFEYEYNEQKWKGGQGDYVLVCPPSYPYMDTFALRDWLNSMVNTINCYTGRDIIVRAKPAKPIRADKAKPLAEAIQGAYAVVTWGSAVALEAMNMGVPTISTGWCPAKAGSFSLEDLETDKLLIEPDRRAINDNLTWSSFDVNEFGKAFDYVLENRACEPLSSI